MVELIRLNGEKFTLNAFMIEQIQSYPDTTITLINGKKIVVKNPEDQVREIISSYYERIGLIGSQHKTNDE